MAKRLKKESKFHKFVKEHFMIVVMIAIMLIPSIYTVLFLGSMWDPYGNTGSLPVAIVNQDEAVSYNGKTLNVGEQLCDNLKENGSLKFNFVDEKVALDGLENGTYYMVMIIPSDFSSNATTLTQKNPKKMEMQYYTNPGTNYIASKFGESAVKTIKESLNKTVIKTYAQTVYANLNTIEDGFNAAADGSHQIYNGVGQLKDGNIQITDGLTALSAGCLTLKEGTGTLKDGLQTYTSGVTQVDNGVSQLSSGTAQLKDGVGTLKAGTAQLVSNNKTLNDGTGQILDGLQYMSSSLASSLTDQNLSDLKTLEAGLDQLNGVIQKVGDVKAEADKVLDDETIASIKQTTSDLDKFVNSEEFDTIYEIINYDAVDWHKVVNTIDRLMKLPIGSEAKKTLESLKGFAEKMIKLQDFEKKFSKEDIQKLLNNANAIVSNYEEVDKQLDTLVNSGSYALTMANKTLEQFKNGLLDVQYGLDKTQAKDGETGLIEGMQTLKAGVATYTGGVEQVDSGADQLGAGVNQLQSGVKQIKNGTSQLVSNNSALNGGATQLDDGAGQLVDGSSKLYDGSVQIGNGCDKLSDGSKTLQTSLEDGAEQISNTNTDDNAADMFSQPVDATETFQRTINANGEAMSAYMMCAGLWVACLAFCLMFSPFKTSLQKRKTFVTHAGIAGFVAVVAPIIMVTLIMAIDGMRPAHVLNTYLMAILTSVAFMAIVYFLNTLLDSIGSFLLLVLLCLNLSGSAGTYPIDLSPKFYQIIHPLVPFTYGVDAFRSTVSTGNSLTKDIVVLLGITIVCTILTVITYEVRRVKLKKQKRAEAQADEEEELDYYNTQTI